MFKIFAWICLAIGLIFLILGVIGALIHSYVLVSPRGCTLLGQLFLLFAMNFLLFRIIQLREQQK
jgi:hypothetical protein